MSPLISIIVPCYNVEQYLPRCIDSILSQSFADFELLLVDDGSKDRSGAICDEYAQKDARIRVFHKLNGGVSSARNLALDNARGEWVCLVDGDDVIPQDALATYIRLISPDVDLVMAGFEKINERGMLLESPAKIVSKTLSHVEALREMFRPSDFSYLGYGVSKLYRTSVIKSCGLKFDEAISFNEDRLFVVNFICHSLKDVAYTTKSVYQYLLREGSAMGSLSKGYNKKFATDFDAYCQMYDVIKSSTGDEQLMLLAKEGICGSYKVNHKMMVLAQAYDSNIHRHMVKYLFKYRSVALYAKLALRTFVGTLSLLICPNLVSKHIKGGVKCTEYKLSLVAPATGRRAA